MVEIEDEQNLDIGMDKFKQQFEGNQIMEKFDKDVFEVLIRKVIIWEETDNKQISPRTLIFVLKNGKSSKKQEADLEEIKNYPVILQFDSSKDIIHFDKVATFTYEKNIESYIKVKVVMGI